MACLDELGNQFIQAGLIAAGQAWCVVTFPQNIADVSYLLSPSSPFFDTTAAAFDKRMMLADGSDEDLIIFAEIAEYARNLVVPPKGSEPPVPGLPQLLPYKLERAWRAAESGDMERAHKSVLNRRLTFANV